MTHEAIRRAVQRLPLITSDDWHDFHESTEAHLVAALLADRDRLAAEVESRQWQPIETAPRSAESILTINQSGRMAIETGYYAHNMMHAAQLDEEECYYTHWMALPASPEEGTS